MAVTKELFGTTQDGGKVYAFTLENANGMKARLINYGATLVNLYVPDKDGKVEDVVLGFDKLEDYYENESFLGSTIGPSANRTGNAAFRVDGKIYQIDANDGPNNLHSSFTNGYHKRVWEVAETGEASVTLFLEAPDGDMGFPGNKRMTMTYSLSDDNALHLFHNRKHFLIINLINLTHCISPLFFSIIL